MLFSPESSVPGHCHCITGCTVLTQEKILIEVENILIEVENIPIEVENTLIEVENIPIEVENIPIEVEIILIRHAKERIILDKNKTLHFYLYILFFYILFVLWCL